MFVARQPQCTARRADALMDSSSKVLNPIAFPFQNLLHSTALPEYKAATIKKPRFILSHYGAFKTFWDWLILIATFYVAIVVPYSASFRDNNKEPSIRTIYSDVFVEVIFIIGELRLVVVRTKEARRVDLIRESRVSHFDHLRAPSIHRLIAFSFSCRHLNRVSNIVCHKNGRSRH